MSNAADPIDVVNDPDRPAEERLAAVRLVGEPSTPALPQAVCEVDLHIHSFFSDGYHSPAGRVLEARQRGMRAISLTDHDNVDGVDEALAAGEICDIEVIPGVEFYTDRPGVEIIGHWPLVGRYHDWIKSGAGTEVIEPIRAAKRKQLCAMMERVPACFAALGMIAEITSEDVHTWVRNGVTTKGDISVIMWQKYGSELAERGLASDVKEFQALYTTQDQHLNVPLELAMDLSPEAFVRRLRAWGALPGLSHPTELRKKEGLGNQALRDLLSALGAEGLQTVEVDGWRNGICPETGREQTDVFLGMLAEYAEAFPHRLPLLPTNGSDDHNQPGEGLELGCGKDRNLRRACGRYAVVEAMKQRAEQLEAVT